MAAVNAVKRGVSEKFYMDFLIAKDLLLNSESDNMTEFEVAFYAKNLSSENAEVRDYAINRLVKYGQNHKSNKAVASRTNYLKPATFAITQVSIVAPSQTKTMKQNRLKESVNCVRKMSCLTVN